MRRLIPLLCALALLFAGAFPVALADDLDDDLAKVGAQIDEVKSQISGAAAQRTELAEQILATDAVLQGLVADLRRAEAEVAAITADVDAAATHLGELRTDLENRYRALDLTRLDLEATRQEARARAVEMYMTGGGGDVRGVLFTAQEVTTVAIGLEYASTVTDLTERLVRRLESLEIQSSRQAEKIAEQEEELAAELARLEKQKERLEELAHEVAHRKSEVQSELNRQQGQLASVKDQIEHFESELVALEREQGRIEALIREAQAQSQSTASSASGGMVRPVPGRVTSGFGWRTHPILGTRRLHTGIDMGSGYGTPIKAAASGRVILAAYYGGYGNAVIIDHGGGTSTLYAHQSRLGVSQGTQVDAGQVIGYVGSTGLSTGPHLHFEVRKNGTPVNPANFL